MSGSVNKALSSGVGVGSGTSASGGPSVTDLLCSSTNPFGSGYSSAVASVTSTVYNESPAACFFKTQAGGPLSMNQQQLLLKPLYCYDNGQTQPMDWHIHQSSRWNLPPTNPSRLTHLLG